jgi:hypothetical protein
MDPERYLMRGKPNPEVDAVVVEDFYQQMMNISLDSPYEREKHKEYARKMYG